MGFIGEHAGLRAAGALAFLTADALNLIALRGHVAFLFFLDLIEQQAAGDEAVESLLARLLAFHLQARGPMHQHHARGSLVDVLPAMAAGTDEGFVDVGLAHAQRGHALGELGLFFQADGKGAHRPRLIDLSENGKSTEVLAGSSNIQAPSTREIPSFNGCMGKN